MLVIFIGAICVVTEWITERCHPQSTPEGALKVREGPCPWRCSGVARGRGGLSPFWGPTSMGPTGVSSGVTDCLALHYLESLKFFAPSKRSEEEMVSSPSY